MSGAIKKKLCWNCETAVAKDLENCRFCGVYLSPTSENEDSLYNILTPPYRLQESVEETESLPQTSLAISQEITSSIPDEQSNMKLIMLTIMFLFSGSMFLLFAVLMIIFSQNGQLILSFNADYWMVYLFLAIPMLFLGWKGLNSIPD